MTVGPLARAFGAGLMTGAPGKPAIDHAFGAGDNRLRRRRPALRAEDVSLLRSTC